MNPIIRKAIGRTLVCSFATMLLVGVVGSVAWGGSSDRVDRQVRIFEMSMDDMLVESPNWLVMGHEPTHGYYAEGRAAVFTFRASLVHSWYKRSSRWWRFLDDWDDDDEDRGKVSKREMERQTKRYERGKDEVIETMLAFGEVLSAVPDNELLEIRAMLRDCYYFDEKDLSRLKFQVKMSDLRAYYDGSLSEKQLTDRIEVDEE